MAAGEEMSQSGGSLHREELGVLRTETHRSRSALDRLVRLSSVDVGPRAGEPRPCIIRIEGHRLFNELIAADNVTDNHGKRESRRAQDYRIVPTHLGGAS